MKKTILRALWKKHLLLCLAMSLITSISVGLLIGGVSFSDSLESGLKKYLEDYGYADITINLNAAYRSSSKDLEKLSGIDAVNARVFLDTSIMKADGTNVAIRAISYNANDFGKFHFWSGEACNGFYIDYQFAKRNGISAGDKISIMLGSEYREVTIDGIVSTPETLGLRRMDSWTSGPSMGYLYFHESILSRTQYAALCNQFLLKTEAGADLETVLESASALLKNQQLTITDTCTKENSQIHDVIRDNVEPLKSLCVLIPSMFFLIVLMVLILCMSILVRHSRKEIGTLRALGYSKKDMMQIFCLLMLSISAIGILLGLPISLLILRILLNYYQNFFPVPALPGSLNILTIALSIFAVLICAVITALVGSAYTASIHPTEAMQRSVPERHFNVSLIQKLFPRTKPVIKFNIATLFRAPGRFAFTVLCLAATVIIIFASLSYRSSCKYFVKELFEERIHFDYLAYFSESPEEETCQVLKQTAGVKDVEHCSYYDVNLSFNGNNIDAPLMAVPADSKAISIPDVGCVPEDGIVLERYVAEKLGTKKGDTVKVNGVQYMVAGISFQVTSRMQYMSLSEAEKLGPSEYGALMIYAEESDALSSVLSNTEGFLYLSSIDDMEIEVRDVFNSMIFVIRLIIICAMILGFVIVLITTRASLSERQREIAIMRSQGFSFNTISRSWLVQSIIQFVPGCIIGLPIGASLSSTILDSVRTQRRAFRYVSDWREYLIAVALLIIYLLIAHFIALRVVKKWNIAEKTKSSE